MHKVGDPKYSKSLLELFILAIVKHLKLTTKQAIGLLADDSKYLAHILAKGFKDKAEPVQLLLLQLTQSLPLLIGFCQNDENRRFFFKSVKPGLISRFVSISETTLKLVLAFIKMSPNKFEVLRDELMETILLSLQRHPTQLQTTVKIIIELIGYHKGLLSLTQANCSINERLQFFLEVYAQAEAEKQLTHIYQITGLINFVKTSLETITNPVIFANSSALLLNIASSNPSFLQQFGLLKVISLLQSYRRDKHTDNMIYIAQIFALLGIISTRKDSAQALLKVLINKYSHAFSEDESNFYIFNFIDLLKQIPTISFANIVENILSKVEASTNPLSSLQITLLRIRDLEGVEDKLMIRMFKALSKVLLEGVGYSSEASQLLVAIISRLQRSRRGVELAVSLTKISLAVHYGNLRKLSLSRPSQGVRIDKNNAFTKLKNNDIEAFLYQFVKARLTLNKNIEALICYSFFQSEIKDKREAEGLRRIICLFGNEDQLRKLYEVNVRDLQQKKRGTLQRVEQNGVRDKQGMLEHKESQVYLVSKAYDGQDSRTVPTSFSQVSLTAQKGLEKYQKVYLQKLARQSAEEQEKRQQQERLEQQKKKIAAKIQEKGIVLGKQCEINCLYEFNVKEKLLERDQVVPQLVTWFQPQHWEDRQIKSLEWLLKKYHRVLLVYFNTYAGTFRTNNALLFDKLDEKKQLMQLANVWKLLKDHYLDEFITIKEVQRIVQKLNAANKTFKDSLLIDFDLFQQFLIQTSFTMFSRQPHDLRSHPVVDMLQELFNNLKAHASDNKIDKNLFEELEEQGIDAPEVRQLNQQLVSNPELILPAGYKKIIDRRVSFNYSVKHPMCNSYKVVLEIIDGILQNCLGLHFIEPYPSTVITCKARPMLSMRREGESHDRGMTKAIKAEIFKFTGKKRELVQEVAAVLMEIVLAVESRKDQLFPKSQNKFLKDKKEREEQLRKREQSEAKRREQRQKELQTLLEQQKEKAKEVEQIREKQREEEDKKIHEERQKKEKHAQQLKRKLESYIARKKQDKEKEQEDNRRKKEEEAKELQKAKAMADKKRKMIQEAKQKSLEQERVAMQKSQASLKQKEEQLKRKSEEKKQQIKKRLIQYKKRKENALEVEGQASKGMDQDK